jgi:hypothetical protein
MTFVYDALEDVTVLSSLEKAVAAAAAPEEKAAAMQKYHEAFAVRSAAVSAAIAQHEQKSAADVAAAEKAADDAEAEVARLEAQLSEESTTSASAGALKTAPGKEYYTFLVARANLVSQLHVLRGSLQGIVASDSIKMPSRADEAAVTAVAWRTREAQLLKEASALEQQAVGLGAFAAADNSTNAVAALIRDVSDLQAAADSKLASYAAREAAVEDGIKEFESERKRLLVWCRQQKTNLDAMVEPDHVQEFCASLLSNFPTMEENFSVLLEVAEPLLPNADVQNALVETNEVWLNLQVSAYERLRHTLLEIHPKSKLEDEVREFSAYSRRAGEFLDEFSRLLSTPSDAESQSFVQPVVQAGEALRDRFPAHEGLASHLRDFSQRMECLRESYNSLRRAVFSRLTFLSSSVPALMTSMRRKEEYVARMKELKRWIDVKSQGESWKDIHQRVLAIRELIEKERQTLASEAKQA